MNPAQSASAGAFVVLAMFLFVGGFSLTFSAAAIPPGFRAARRQIVLVATACIAASLVLASWVIRA